MADAIGGFSLVSVSVQCNSVTIWPVMFPMEAAVILYNDFLNWRNGQSVQKNAKKQKVSMQTSLLQKNTVSTIMFV
jgi:hypothetical protein